MAHSLELFPGIFSIVFFKRAPVSQLGEVSCTVICAACCHMALVFAVSQLGEVSCSVICAACCHMALVFAVMHLYHILEFFIASVHSFFILF